MMYETKEAKVLLSQRLAYPLSFVIISEQMCKTINTPWRLVLMHNTAEWNFDSELEYCIQCIKLKFGRKFN